MKGGGLGDEELADVVLPDDGVVVGGEELLDELHFVVFVEVVVGGMGVVPRGIGDSPSGDHGLFPYDYGQFGVPLLCIAEFPVHVSGVVAPWPGVSQVWTGTCEVVECGHVLEAEDGVAGFYVWLDVVQDVVELAAVFGCGECGGQRVVGQEALLGAGSFVEVALMGYVLDAAEDEE